MARSCSVCTHESRDGIDRALVAGRPYREIAKRHGVTIASLGRHRAAHLSPAIVQAHGRKESRRGDSLLSRVETIVDKLEDLADEAHSAGKAGTLLQAARELRETYKLIGNLTGELDDRPQSTVNVLVAPQWVSIKDALLGALAAHPEARAAVSGALLELEEAS